MSSTASGADVHELVGAYVLHALDPDERRFFERHIGTCLECRIQVAEFSDAASVLARVVEEPPPAGLRERVLAAVAETPQQQPVVPAPTSSTANKWLMAAAAVLVMIAAGLGAFSLRATQRIDQLERDVAQVGQDVARAERDVALAEQEVARAEQEVRELAAQRQATLAVISAPDAQVVTLSEDSEATARVVWSSEQDEAVLIAAGLEPAPEGQAYALWLIEGETPNFAAFFTPGEDGQVVVPIERLASADAIGVTLEPADSTPEAPTGDILISGALS